MGIILSFVIFFVVLGFVIGWFKPSEKKIQQELEQNNRKQVTEEQKEVSLEEEQINIALEAKKKLKQKHNQEVEAFKKRQSENAKKHAYMVRIGKEESSPYGWTTENSPPPKPPVKRKRPYLTEGVCSVCHFKVEHCRCDEDL